jgi:hypothetical protein
LVFGELSVSIKGLTSSTFISEAAMRDCGEVSLIMLESVSGLSVIMFVTGVAGGGIVLKYRK